MIFLDTDHEWILARDRQELVAALLDYLEPNDDNALLRLAAACLNCSEEDIAIIGL